MFLRLFDSYIESSLHESDFQSDPDEISSHMNDSDTIYDPEVDIVDNTAKFEKIGGFYVWLMSRLILFVDGWIN